LSPLDEPNAFKFEVSEYAPIWSAWKRTLAAPLP
jgi:hypothetical protein